MCHGYGGGRAARAAGTDLFDRAVSTAECSERLTYGVIYCYSMGVTETVTEYAVTTDLSARAQRGQSTPFHSADEYAVSAHRQLQGTGDRGRIVGVSGTAFRDHVRAVQLWGVASVRCYANLYCETNCINLTYGLLTQRLYRWSLRAVDSHVIPLRDNWQSLVR